MSALTAETESGRLSGAVFLGFGGCGVNILESWLEMLPDDALCIALDRDEKEFHKKSAFKHKLVLFNVKSVGSTVEYSKSVQAEVERSMDTQMPELEAMLQDRNNVIILAGLGGVIGTWASQFICNRLTAMGKQVVTVLVMPFGFESERVKVAEYALPSFDGDAHRVLCFNDYLIKHTPEHTSMADAFEIMNQKAFELLNVPE